MHPHGQGAIVVALGDREQLHDVAEPLGGHDVVGSDLADALVVHVAGDDANTERDRGDDRRLRSGVVAIDVRGGITLGVAEALGLGEGVAVGGARFAHPREDVVGGAVDDAEDAADRLTRQ